MGLVLQLDGPAGQVIPEIVRLLPDGRDWMVSDPEGAVIIAREDRHLVREAIFTSLEDGTYDVEVLASAGVSEGSLQVLVGASLVACLASIIAVWVFGPGGLMGLVFGITLAGTVPALVLAIGQRFIDPGRDEGAEKQTARALRFAIAQCQRARLLTTE